MHILHFWIQNFGFFIFDSALRLGLPFVPSYLGQTGSVDDMIQGVNYASAGSGIIFSSGSELVHFPLFQFQYHDFLLSSLEVHFCFNYRISVVNCAGSAYLTHTADSAGDRHVSADDTEHG